MTQTFAVSQATYETVTTSAWAIQPPHLSHLDETIVENMQAERAVENSNDTAHVEAGAYAGMNMTYQNIVL